MTDIADLSVWGVWSKAWSDREPQGDENWPWYARMLNKYWAATYAVLGEMPVKLASLFHASCDALTLAQENWGPDAGIERAASFAINAIARQKLEFERAYRYHGINPSDLESLLEQAKCNEAAEFLKLTEKLGLSNKCIQDVIEAQRSLVEEITNRMHAEKKWLEEKIKEHNEAVRIEAEKTIIKYNEMSLPRMNYKRLGEIYSIHPYHGWTNGMILDVYTRPDKLVLSNETRNVPERMSALFDVKTDAENIRLLEPFAIRRRDGAVLVLFSSKSGEMVAINGLFWKYFIKFYQNPRLYAYNTGDRAWDPALMVYSGERCVGLIAEYRMRLNWAEKERVKAMIGTAAPD